MLVEPSPEAVAVVDEVRAQRAGRLSFTINNGCCESTAPYLYEDYAVAGDLEQVGDVAGVPVYAPQWIRDLYAGDTLVLGVDRDVLVESMSVETDLGCRFNLMHPDQAGQRPTGATDGCTTGSATPTAPERTPVPDWFKDAAQRVMAYHATVRD